MSGELRDAVGVTGASGFLGGAVCELLVKQGVEVVGFSRDPGRAIPNCREVRAFQPPEPPDFSGLRGVLHLAGENILGLWTDNKKERIRESRVQGTSAVTAACGRHGVPVLVNASAIGFYGATGETPVDESSPHGTGFLADVTRAWESAAESGPESLRVAIVRCGLLLGRGGGAMRLMGPAFRSGLAGPLGNGRQWMAPIHVRDAAGIFLHLLNNAELSGPFNAVLPEPVRNSEFTKAAGQAAKRPAILPAPAFFLKAALGELAGLLLDSTRVLPRRTLEAGYSFAFPSLHEVLEDVFSRN